MIYGREKAKQVAASKTTLLLFSTPGTRLSLTKSLVPRVVCSPAMSNGVSFQRTVLSVLGEGGGG